MRVVQRERAELDGAQHQQVGESLGDGEQAEDGVLRQRPRVRGVVAADGLVENELAAEGDLQNSAVIEARGDIGPDNRFEMIETSRTTRRGHTPPPHRITGIDSHWSESDW